MKLLIIRPQPGADATAHRLRAAGHDPLIMPLFAIQHLPLPQISAAGFDALLLTSGNAARAAVDFLTSDHHLPVYAVGSATAAALQRLAVPVAQTGAEGVEALVRGAAANGHKRLLWLAGEDHSSIPSVAGAHIDLIIVYRSAAVPPPAEFAANVTTSDVVILHSSRAGVHFARLCETTDLQRNRITLATFSEAIAHSAGSGWASTIVAAAPNDAALLDALQSQCTAAYSASSAQPAIEGPI